MLPPPPRAARWTVRLGFRTGLAVGVVLVSAIRGCALDAAQIARSLADDTPAAQMASTTAAPAADDTSSPPPIPTANVEALPRAAVRVEDLPRSRTR